MINPFNFPADDALRFSEEHEMKQGRRWAFRYKVNIPGNSTHSFLFRTKNYTVAVRKISISLTSGNQSVLSRLSFFESPVFTGGTSVPVYPLNRISVFPLVSERVDILSGLTTVSNNGSLVFPETEREVNKNASSSVSIASFFILKPNTEYHGLIEDLSNTAEDYNIAGLISYIDI